MDPQGDHHAYIHCIRLCGLLSSRAKEELAAAIAAVHDEAIGANSFFAQVMLHDVRHTTPNAVQSIWQAASEVATGDLAGLRPEARLQTCRGHRHFDRA
ncbi:hypothetical protein [Cupriavidus sp. CuC1]|uniref:hypothetical protein n=1 Tax=Cupriavidus sp. CuC1 TaxID=3373131 RepID=UPI0037CEECEF